MVSALLLSYGLTGSEEKTERYIRAVALWTLFHFAITEILSAFHGITPGNLWICWLTLDAALLVLNIARYKKRGLKWSDHLPVGQLITGRRAALGLLAAGMLYLALRTAPYNWDSMTYHLPRLFHWLQNGSVAYYATHIDRQVASPVLGAYVNLHVYAMTGGEDWALNLLQCFSFLTNGILVFQIAARIKCSRPWCTLAAALHYSMPIAFAEALTTQVDNYAALWMLCLVYLILDLLDPKEKLVFDRRTLIRVVTLSLCVAFGYLAKPSVGVGMVFFALWLLLILIKRRDSVLTAGLYALVGGCILALILAPGLYRNIVTYASFSSPDAGQRQLIGSLHPRHILVNLAKNFTFNLPTVWLYDSSFLIWKYVIRFSRLLEIDIDSPVISEDGREFVVRDPQNYGNSTAVSPLIVWLMIACIALFLLKNRKRRLSEIRNQYFIAAAMSFLAFCAVLRWEPFVGRYMISYLAVLCPAVAGQLELFLESGGGRGREVRAGTFAVLWFLCITEGVGLLYFHGDIARRSESEGYFISREEIAQDYRETARFINDSGCRRLGLLIGGDSYEYPLTAMLDPAIRTEHVNVTNATERYEDPDFIPDMIVVINCAPDGAVLCHGCEYEVKNSVGENIRILEKNNREGE